MVVLYPDLMPAAERSRLAAMLGESPLVAEPFTPWSRRRTQRVLGLAIALAMIFAFDAPLPWLARGDTSARSLVLALAAAGSAGLVTAWLLARRHAKTVRSTSYPSGRFIYSFGYVESWPGRVAIVPGRSITNVGVHVGKPSRSGASWITVTISSGALRRRVRFRGLDLDVPADELDEVLRSSWEIAESYREARPLFSSHAPRPSRDAGPWLAPGVTALVALGALAVTFTAVLPARVLLEASRPYHSIEALSTLSRTGWTPWLRRAALAALNHRLDSVEAKLDGALRDPWRGEVLELVRSARSGAPIRIRSDHGTCTRSRERADMIDRWVREHHESVTPARFASHGLVGLGELRRPLVPYWTFVDDYPTHLGPRWHERLENLLGDLVTEWTPHGGATAPRSPPAATLTTACSVVPVDLATTSDGRNFALLRAEITVSLEVAGRLAVRETRVVQPADQGLDDTPPYVGWHRWVDDQLDAMMLAAMFRN